MLHPRIDPNFVRTSVSEKGLLFIDPLEHPSVELWGFPYHKKEHVLCRIPQKAVPLLSELGQWVCWHSAGGALRFRTDASRIFLRARFSTGESNERATMASLFGFDAYRGEGTHLQFVKTLYGLDKNLGFKDGIDSIPEGEHEWTLYFPLRNHVRTLELGLPAGARLLTVAKCRVTKPVLFYGSSIVEGGCASRSGLTYPAQIGRMLDVETINWGFGGSAKGEQAVARAIAGLDLAALVYDYDHNAPSPEHLEKTHEPFFKTIRKKQPDLPVIMLSSVNGHINSGYFGKRNRIIEKTYRNARSQGDRNVWFIPGQSIFPKESWGDCTVDLTHPNDRGFRLMAEVIGKKLRSVLGV